MFGNDNTRRAMLGFIIGGAMLGCALLATGADLYAEEAPLWGGLEPGPYAVGFMASEEYDHARTFQPKRDYFGTVLEGERARPIQICMWYPADAPSDEMPVVLSDYAFVPPDDLRFYEFLAAVQNREIRLLHQILAGNQVAVLEALSTGMKGIKDAKPAEGAFPLLIYHSNFNRGIAENAVMCEYLASQGFVVATTHSFAQSAVTTEPGLASLETMVRDIEFMIAALRGMDFIDHGKLGVFGHGAGGLAALLLQMRNYDVDAVGVLEPGYAGSDHVDILTGNPYYDVGRMSVPLLEAHASSETAEEESFVEWLRYSSRLSLEFPGAHRIGLTSYGLLPPAFLTSGAPEPSTNVATHGNLCRYVLAFFDAYLNGAEPSLAFLGRSPEENGMDPAGLELTRVQGAQRPPTQDEFLGMLEEGRIDTAAYLFERFTAEEPDLVLFPEPTMNYMGYRYLQQGMVPQAIAIFKMNAETYPLSANCWDSLAEAYIASGDNEHAIECVERVLEVLPDDANASPELKETLRANAERYMQMLKEE
jgi:hypothetical protein